MRGGAPVPGVLPDLVHFDAARRVGHQQAADEVAALLRDAHMRRQRVLHVQDALQQSPH